MNAVAKQPTKGQMLEDVLIRGDLKPLTEEQRSEYYMMLCNKLGLNHLTQPFAYIVLNGKLTLYALKGATDQLRTIKGVSVEEMTHAEREDSYIVTVKVRMGDRTDMSTGVVSIGHLKGEARANAMMKAETKAKRRATLSLCGLGMLDETEIEDIPTSAKAPAPPAPAAPVSVKNIPENIPKLPPHDPQTGEIIEGKVDTVEHDGIPAFLNRNGKPTIPPIPVPEKDDGTANWINWAQLYIEAAKTTDVQILADANDMTLETMGAEAPIAKRRMFAAINRNKQEAGQ